MDEKRKGAQEGRRRASRRNREEQQQQEQAAPPQPNIEQELEQAAPPLPNIEQELEQAAPPQPNIEELEQERQARLARRALIRDRQEEEDNPRQEERREAVRFHHLQQQQGQAAPREGERLPIRNRQDEVDHDWALQGDILELVELAGPGILWLLLPDLVRNSLNLQ